MDGVNVTPPDSLRCSRRPGIEGPGAEHLLPAKIGPAPQRYGRARRPDSRRARSAEPIGTTIRIVAAACAFCTTAVPATGSRWALYFTPRFRYQPEGPPAERLRSLLACPLCRAQLEVWDTQALADRRVAVWVEQGAERFTSPAMVERWRAMDHTWAAAGARAELARFLEQLRPHLGESSQVWAVPI